MAATQVQLAAAARTELGKGPSGRLRHEARVPGIMYGYEVEPTAVHVDALELYHVLHTEAGANVLIRLDIEGQEHLTVAREIQRHPVRGDVTHLDFLAVDRDAAIEVELPVHYTGEPESPGLVQQVLLTVPVKVKPLEVPPFIEVSIDGFQIGDVVRVEDLPLPDGMEPAIDPARTVITINAPQLVEVEESDEDVEGELIEGDAVEAEATEAGGDE